jgi:hypothetical protein
MPLLRIIAVWLPATLPAAAQRGAPDVTFGHIHIYSADPTETIAFWTNIIGISTWSRDSLNGVRTLGVVIVIGMPQVVLWADTFNNYFHPEVAAAATEVLEDAGFRVIVPRAPLCCGRPLYDYGFFDRADARRNGLPYSDHWPAVPLGDGNACARKVHTLRSRTQLS